MKMFTISHQSDREKGECLAVAPFMDRDKVTKATAQIGFIKFVLVPLFESLSKVSSKLKHSLFFHFKPRVQMLRLSIISLFIA